jgi:undecaprenyl pyrophosphate phosphatase UppP
MNQATSICLKQWIKAPLFSPRGFTVRAIIIALLFAVCHSLGLREYTSFISGTPTSADTSLQTSAVIGLIYMASYFAFVLLTPILLVAAAVQAVLERLLRRSAHSRRISPT